MHHWARRAVEHARKVGDRPLLAAALAMPALAYATTGPSETVAVGDVGVESRPDQIETCAHGSRRSAAVAGGGRVPEQPTGSSARRRQQQTRLVEGLMGTGSQSFGAEHAPADGSVVRSPSMALSTRCSNWVNWMTWPSARLTGAGGVRYPDPCDCEISSTPSLVRERRPGRAQRRPTPSGSGRGSWGATDYWLMSDS